MEKKTVGKFDLDAAFKALDEIEIPKVTPGSRTTANRINLRERLHAKAAHEVLVEDYYDLNDAGDMEAAKTEREAEIAKAKLARIEKIVDLDAKTEDDILPSYVGKYIIQCPQCMTLFYKNEEDIVEAEDNPGTVNISEVCQHCGNDSGYSLIGKVDGITPDESADFEGGEIAEEEVPAAEEEVPAEEMELDVVEDSEDAAEEGGELDLADLEGLALEDEEETVEEEVEESLNNSKLLSGIRKKNALKSEHSSEYTTLYEDAELMRGDASNKEPVDAFDIYIDKSGSGAQADKAAPMIKDFKMQHPDAKINVYYFDDVRYCEPLAAAKAGKQIIVYTDGDYTANCPELADFDNVTLINAVQENLEEDLADWYRKTFDKPASSKTQKNWEDALEDGSLDAKTRAKFIKKFAQQREWEKNHPDKVNHEPDLKPVAKPKEEESVPEEVLTEKAKTSTNAENILDNLWKQEQPTEAETRNALKRLVSKTKVENFEDLEDFDEESFDSHISEYLTEVYSNVKTFKTTSCSTDKGRLIVEGLLTFNSGKAKKTKFIFEGSRKGICGYNSDISDSKAFSLKTSIVDNRLLTEGLKYKYSIGETLIKGDTAK